MVQDPRIRAGIFAGESGGDYNALFGFRNRQPGAPQVSDMTVGEVIDFTMPQGGYGQAVKSEIGRVATPVGAYQIVGTTLRDAVNKLGIDPNTPFNQQTQDMLGQYILEQQGTGAWEGYRGPQDPGEFLDNFDARLSTSGGQGGGYGGGQLPLMQDEPLPFLTRARAGMANIADIMRTTNTGVAPSRPGDDIIDRHRDKQGRNQTAQALHQQGHTDLANMVMGGQMTGAQAMAYLAQTQPDMDPGSWASAGNGLLYNTKTGQTRSINGPGGPGAGRLTDPKDVLTAGNALRDDFNKSTGTHADIINGYTNVVSGLENPGAISDVQLAVSFTKLLDPGSVAREGEVAIVTGAAGLGDRLTQAINHALAGTGTLTRTQKQQIYRLAREKYVNSMESISGERDRFGGVADRYGIPRDVVLGGARELHPGFAEQELEDLLLQHSDGSGAPPPPLEPDADGRIPGSSAPPFN